MRILLAGATGVIGRQAVPVLAAAGHEGDRPGPDPGPAPRRRGPAHDVATAILAAVEHPAARGALNVVG